MLYLHGHKTDLQHCKSILTITKSKSNNNIKLSMINCLAFLNRMMRIVLTACFQNPRFRSIYCTNPQSVRFLRPNPQPINLSNLSAISWKFPPRCVKLQTFDDQSCHVWHPIRACFGVTCSRLDTSDVTVTIGATSWGHVMICASWKVQPKFFKFVVCNPC